MGSSMVCAFEDEDLTGQRHAASIYPTVRDACATRCFIGSAGPVGGSAKTACTSRPPRSRKRRSWHDERCDVAIIVATGLAVFLLKVAQPTGDLLPMLQG